MEHVRSGDLDGAVQEFEAVLTTDPKYSAAYYHGGQALEKLGKLDRGSRFIPPRDRRDARSARTERAPSRPGYTGRLRGFVAPLCAFSVDRVADGGCRVASRAPRASDTPPPREAPPPPEPYNQLDSSETLFYVLAAINAAGYDEQADSSTNNPLRARVREYLAKQNLPSLAPAEAIRAGS